jgi:cytochrome c-type biogenesis protein CcmE
MTRKQKRLATIAVGLGFLGLATALTLVALGQKTSYFYMPADLAEAAVDPGQRIRLGGLVAENSVQRGTGTMVTFSVTDTAETIVVRYSGLLPDLFREGQGIVAEGVFSEDGVFIADTVLAKHDENYMPKEVAEGLKEQGLWQHGGGSESGGGDVR